MEDEIEFKKEMSLTFGEIGKAAGDDVELTGEHPNVWANCRFVHGTKRRVDEIHRSDERIEWCDTTIGKRKTVLE